jgi:hypothetical protein
MTKDEARRIALERVAELRGLSWIDLRDRYLDQPETVERLGASGVTYQVETEAFWDGAEGADIRVIVGVDDGRLRAFMPLTEVFIMAPDGSFVGE